MAKKIVHLFRGSEVTRIWSKYKETNKFVTLCGIRDKDNGEIKNGTQDPNVVTCPRCAELLAPEFIVNPVNLSDSEEFSEEM